MYNGSPFMKNTSHILWCHDYLLRAALLTIFLNLNCILRGQQGVHHVKLISL